MTDVVSWLISAELVGLAAFPLVFRAFPRLSDRGFGLAIPAGMLIVSTIVWLLSYVDLLPNSTWSWWLIVLLVAVGGGFAVRRHVPDIQKLFREKWPALVAAQVVFLVFFALFALLRANDPNITNTEKPMEILMLNAAVSTEFAPPADPWLAGETVAYYYGGYWNLGGISTLSSVSTANAFNLSLALIAAMSASAMFTLVYSMVSRDSGGILSASLSGVGASLLLLVAASLAGWWELGAHLAGMPYIDDSVGQHLGGLYRWLEIDGLEPSVDSSGLASDQFWWWFRASRVINTFDEAGVGLDFTIQEFPAFSFILGDLHPHVISIPFVIVAITGAYSLFISTDRWGWRWLRRNPYSAGAIGLIVGTSGFINQADILLMAALFGGTVALKAYGESGKNLIVSTVKAAPPLAVIAGIGVIVFSPFYFGTLGGQLQSPPIAPVEFGTRPVHFLTVWGVFLLLAAPFVVMFAGPLWRRYGGAAWRSRSEFALAPSGLGARFADLRYAEDDQKPIGVSSNVTETPTGTEPLKASEQDLRLLRRLDRWVWITPLVLVGVPYVAWAVTHLGFNDGATVSDVFTRLGTALPLGILFVGLFFVITRKALSGTTPASLFALLLATLSIYMLFGAELFFVHDLFGNRMNTVFKFYYQVWIMMSVVAGYAAFYWVRSHRFLEGIPKLASRTAVVALAVLLVGPVWYPFAAGTSKANDYTGPVTLDGWAFLERFNQADAAAIDWLLDESEPGERIVEAVGGSYTDHGRISAATGLQAVLGWEGHERQWRGTDDLFVGRAEDVRALYETSDEAEARRLLDEYDVTYVVIGARERAGYTGLQAAKFDSLGQLVFESDGIAIYNVQGQAS